MMPSLSSAVSGLSAEQSAMNVTGNNIANASTVGFKSSSVQFAALLYQILTNGSAPGVTATVPGGTNPEAEGVGVQVGAINQNMGQGTVESTGVPTDLAIQGNGFLSVADGASTYLTRVGNLQIDAAGNLVESANGWKVQGWSAVTPGAAGSPATPASVSTWPPTSQTSTNTTGLIIPSQISGNGNQQTTSGMTYSLQSLSIGQNGDIVGVYTGQTAATATTPATTQSVTITLGQIALGMVANPAGLTPVSDTAFAVAPDSGPATFVMPNTGGSGAFISGALEQSNVNIATEMTNMVTVQAGYQADTKVITTDQQLLTALMQMA